MESKKEYFFKRENKRIVHVLITKFNVHLKLRLASMNKDKRLPVVNAGRSFGTVDEWMRLRIKLFRKYCFPSVVAQTNQNFVWLIAYAQDTKLEHRKALQEFERDNIIFIDDNGRGLGDLGIVDNNNPIFGGPGFVYYSDHLKAIADSAEVLIMSRLDNDDALSIDYIERVQGTYLDEFLRLEGVNPWLVNMIRGYKLDLLENKLYTTRMHNSPFHSLFQHRSPGDKIFGFGNHSTIHKQYKTKQDEFAGWLQTIHDRNVWNRIKPGDVQVPMSNLGIRFAFAE